MRKVKFALGDSTMPPTPPHGGSQTMANVGSAVQDGCDKLRRQAIKLAAEDEESPLHGLDAGTIVVRDGRLHVKGDPARGQTAPAENSIRAGQAACEYSWRTPPSRSRRRMFRSVIRSGSVIGSGTGRSGAAWVRAWWARCWL